MLARGAARTAPSPRTVFSVPDPPRQLAALLARLPPGRRARDRVAPTRSAAAGSLGQRLARDRGLASCRTSPSAPAPRRAGPALYLHDVADPGNVGTVLRVGAGVRSRARRAEPAHGRPVRPQGGARQHGRRLRRSRSSRADFAGRAEARRGARSRSCRAPGGRCASVDARRAGAVRARRRAGRPAREIVVAACDEIAHVPLDRGGADSLNVAMAATLCLYEYRATPCLTRASDQQRPRRRAPRAPRADRRGGRAGGARGRAPPARARGAARAGTWAARPS